jgi:hypothetical protein
VVVVASVVEGAGVGAELVVVGAVEGVEAVVGPDEACVSGEVRAFFLLLSEAATPDEYEPEACFDRMGVLEMDAGAAEIDPIGISSGLGADPAGAPSDGAGLGETMSGAATAQITKASAANVIMHARTTKNGRFPQTGLIAFILARVRIQHYPSFGGGRLL